MALLFGAIPCADGQTEFRLWAPAQQRVALETPAGLSWWMHSDGEGWFTVRLPLGAGSLYRYRIRHDGSDLLIPDPAARAQHDDVHGFSRVDDPSAYVWGNSAWRGRQWHEAVFYELHCGLSGGFAGVEKKLPHLAALGVTAIELMPVAEFPGQRNWGYDGVLLFAPDRSYGTPDELRHLVDAAHGYGLMIFLDVVYNHFGPDGNYLGLLAPPFYRHDQHTPWGDAIDFRVPEVRAFFLQNALCWINDYRFDGLRLDAVHAIQDDDGWLAEMALAVRAGAPGRQVHLVVENEHNVASLLDPQPHRFDAQWNDDFHHVVHVLLTGETPAHLADYSAHTSGRLARVLASGFDYQGEPSAYRDNQPRGTQSGHLPPTAFVNFLQNHDQVGNRAKGDRLITLADPQALEAAVALLLLSPQIPMIFMGDEVGSDTPFLFFTDHHQALAQLVRDGRHKDFEDFIGHRDDVGVQFPDPNLAATFDMSRPQPGPQARTWQDLYARLLHTRHALLVPRLPGARSSGARALSDSAVAAEWTLGDGSRLAIACNLGKEPVDWGEAPAAGQLIFASHGDGHRLPARCTRVYLVSPAAN